MNVTTFSPEYKALQEQFHQERADYGVSGAKYSDPIYQLAMRLKTKDILDYGCGKCTLARSLPFPIQNYDPFIPEHSARPHPADIVVCTDVMEHVEPAYVFAVLNDIAGLTKKMAFFEIATRPASKVLPDGRNAHITIWDATTWLNQLFDHFKPMSFQDLDGKQFLFIGVPL